MHSSPSLEPGLPHQLLPSGSVQWLGDADAIECNDVRDLMAEDFIEHFVA
jgi:hypothetical protein